MAASTVPLSGGEMAGAAALERLRTSEPALFLSPSPELSRAARLASVHLFSSLLPFCPKPPPLDCLLAGEDFDAEQIWGQIDEMSRPLVSMLTRDLKRLEREPPAPIPLAPPAAAAEAEEDSEEADEEADNALSEEDEDEDGEGEGEGDEDEEEEEEEGDVGEYEKDGGVEDRFLKMKELEEYMVRDEAKEYGHPEPETKKKKKYEEDDDEDEEEDEDDDEDEDDLELGSFDGDISEGEDFGESARYEDYFEGKKKVGGDKNNNCKKETGLSKKVKFADELENYEMDDEPKDHEDAEPQDGILSAHEKEIRKIQSKIEQMEKANLEPKSWTMQGEVTAGKRPKNSALEVDLDFEHNMRPAPVITEEVTVSLEDLIRKRIIEGHFDDVQKSFVLPSKAPKELKEMDENKSKKGLAEIYEEEYAQKAGLVSAPLSSSDEQKKEATILFKHLSLKLDALSHFHFAPKPVIEDMSIQVNVPALAMEEIAPLAISDAAMLAPEEIFEGKGDIKEEKELTQAERKRRRANKKRKYKAEEAKRGAKRARVNADLGRTNDGSTGIVSGKARLSGESGRPNGN